MGNVTSIGIQTRAPHTPEHILDAAKDQGLTRVMVVGTREDGSLWFSGSHSDVPDNLFELERAKLVLLGVATDREGQ